VEEQIASIFLATSYDFGSEPLNASAGRDVEPTSEDDTGTASVAISGTERKNLDGVSGERPSTTQSRRWINRTSRSSLSEIIQLFTKINQF
jgi:hypothetical protein